MGVDQDGLYQAVQSSQAQVLSFVEIAMNRNFPAILCLEGVRRVSGNGPWQPFEVLFRCMQSPPEHQVDQFAKGVEEYGEQRVLG